MSVEGVADMEESGETASFGRLRTRMVIGRLMLWSRRMELRKRRALAGVVVRIVALAPWEEKTLAISIIGIWWPPPINGKKYMTTGVSDESMDAETKRVRLRNGFGG